MLIVQPILPIVINRTLHLTSNKLSASTNGSYIENRRTPLNKLVDAGPRELWGPLSKLLQAELILAQPSCVDPDQINRVRAGPGRAGPGRVRTSQVRVGYGYGATDMGTTVRAGIPVLLAKILLFLSHVVYVL